MEVNTIKIPTYLLTRLDLFTKPQAYLYLLNQLYDVTKLT